MSARSIMSTIAARFPSIRHFPGVDPFDAPKLAAQYPGRSHGEQLAIRFVLMVWNGCEGFTYPSDPNDPTGEFGDGLIDIPRFDLYEAWGVWDQAHWRAFIAWASHDSEFRP